jgi:tetratricopeptide (TPR) repeat protein
MTHAESQDLLVDLAYGELEPARAAEVATHVEGCADCRKEKAALEEARRLSAPLRDLEEPSPGFDDRILAAARAEAQLQHDGNLGEVVEVTGSVRPMGLEAARIDAHAPVKTRPVEGRRPRWMVRAAMGGSVAAAAVLALVVSTTLDSRRTAETAAASRAQEYQIRVQPAAPQAVDTALRDAEAKREADRGAAQQTAPAQAPNALKELKEQEKVAKLRAPARTAPRTAGGAQAGRMEGSGGDAADSKRAAAARGPELPMSETSRTTAPAVNDAVRSPPAGVAAPEARAKKATAAEVPAAGAVEANAQQARHAANYALAASLYRNAAELRQRDGDASAAAWNLAHAIECLAAIGQFDEARRVRDELVRRYPGEITALSAARRALREVDVPAASPPR